MTFDGYNAVNLDLLYIIAILLGIFVIIGKNPIVSVLFLIGLFLCIAAYLILIGLNFTALPCLSVIFTISLFLFTYWLGFIYNSLLKIGYYCVKLDWVLHNPPKPHTFSSISLQSSGMQADSVEKWLSAKAKLEEKLASVKTDLLSTQRELKEAKSVSTLCNLVDDSKNTSIGPMKEKFAEFFDEESGNDTKEGMKEVVNTLTEELNSIKYKHNNIKKNIAHYVNKIEKNEKLAKEVAESSNVNSVLLFLVRPLHFFSYLRPLLSNILPYFSLLVTITSFLISIRFVFPDLDVPYILHDISNHIQSFIRYEIAISLPLFIWSFYSYTKNLKRYLNMSNSVIHFFKTSNYIDIWLLLAMFTVNIFFF